MATRRLLLGILVAALLTSACTSDDGLTDSDPVPVGQTESVTTEQFDTATNDAADLLLHAPSVRATLEDRSDGETVASVWVDYRNSGDFIEVSITRSAEDSVMASITSWVDGRLLEARIPGGFWSLGSGARIPPFPIDLTGDIEAPDLDPLRIEVTRQELSNGGAMWERTAVFPEGERHEEWVIHPDGHAVSITSESDPAILPFQTDGTRTSRITYELLDDPDPIPPPRQGTRLDLEQYDIPDDPALMSEVSRR